MENTEFFDTSNIVVTAIGQCFEDNITQPWTHHSRIDILATEFPKYYYSLRWHMSGGLIHIEDGEEYEIDDNNALVLQNQNPEDYVVYNRKSTQLPFHYISLGFSSNEKIYPEYLDKKMLRVYPKEKEKLTEMFSKALSLSRSNTPGWKLECKSIIYSALYILFRTYFNQKELFCSNDMYKTILYINDHIYDKKIVIKDLADNIHVSNVHFSRLFSKTFGISPKQYITDKKLEGVASSLAYTDMSVSSICEQMGFEDMSYFNKIFKRKYKMSPREYRKNQRL